jgi:HD superfamily phosphodiesterase
MKTFNNAISRGFARLVKTRKFTSTSQTRPTTPITKSRTAPIADALESSPHYLKMSPLNKALPKLPQPSQPIPTTPHTLETDYPLLNMDALNIPPADRAWFTAVNTGVRTAMNTLDASHNYQHIRRVVSNAAYILAEEKKTHEWARDINILVLWVTCLTHDIGDTKYKSEGEDRSQSTIVDEFLESFGCPVGIRKQVARLAPHVSFTAEMADEAGVLAFVHAYPVLRVVQDADRLDGLGAVGVSRLFVYGGVDQGRRKGLLGSGIELIEGRFAQYVRLMKTRTGREVAQERYRWMVQGFVERWKIEADSGNV